MQMFVKSAHGILEVDFTVVWDCLHKCTFTNIIAENRKGSFQQKSFDKIIKNSVQCHKKIPY